MIKSLLSINNYHYLRGGAEKVFLDHNQLFTENGWRVAPFSMQGDKNLDSEWARYFIKEIEFGESYSLGEKVVNAFKIIHSGEAKRKIADLVRDFRPDIAHGHNIYHHISTSILPELRKQGVPVVLTLHDLKIACPAYTMLSNGTICEKCKGGIHNVFVNKCMKNSTLLSGLIMAEAYFNQLFGMYQKNVNRYVVPSQFYIDKFVEWGFPRSQFVHIPNYVELHDSPASAGEVGDYFVYAGRLSREKGLLTLVKAAAAQKKKLIIAGSGPEELTVKQLAKDLGADNIEFAGYLNRPQLSALVAGSRAVIVPSEWYENCPMSIIESFAGGKPVIGSDVGGISEMIDEGQDGYKFTMGSVEELTAKLVQIGGLSEGAIRDMGQHAVAKVKARYSKEQYLEKTLDLYRSLIH